MPDCKAEEEQLSALMLNHGIEWEKKGTHEKHLSVLDLKKKERSRKAEELEAKKFELQSENKSYEEINENLIKQLIEFCMFPESSTSCNCPITGLWRRRIIFLTVSMKFTRKIRN